MNPPRHGAAADLVPLSSLPVGAEARLSAIDAGAGLRARLVAMGLRPGVPLRVVRNRGGGPFVVAAAGTRIMLGRGMAHKVLVRAADGQAPAGPA